MPQKDEKRRR